MNPDQEPTEQPPLNESHLPPKVEAEFVNRRTFVIAGGLILAVIVFVLFAAGGLTLVDRMINPLTTDSPLARLTQQPPDPLLTVNEPVTREHVEATAMANISQYGFVDQTTGIVRIPVEDAMKILVEHGETYSVSITSTQGITPTDFVQRGAALFKDIGCKGCHSGENTNIAPTLVGLYGAQVQLEGGQTVTADDAYIRQSILDPSSQLVLGYSAKMPSFASELNDLQITALLAYIKSIGGQQ